MSIVTKLLFNFLGTMHVENYLDEIQKLTVEKKSVISKLIIILALIVSIFLIIVLSDFLEIINESLLIN